MPKKPSNPVQYYERDKLDALAWQAPVTRCCGSSSQSTGLREPRVRVSRVGRYQVRTASIVEVRNKPEIGFTIKTVPWTHHPLAPSLAEKLLAEKQSIERMQVKSRFVFGTRSNRPNTKMLLALKREAFRLGLNCGTCESCVRPQSSARSGSYTSSAPPSRRRACTTVSTCAA